MLFFAERPAGAALDERCRNDDFARFFFALFDFVDGGARQLASDFGHIDGHTGQIRRAAAAAFVLEADQAHVFRDFAAVLAESFACAEGQLIGTGENGGHGPALFEDVSHGCLSTFELVIGESDGVDVRIELQLRNALQISVQPVAVPGLRIVSEIPDIAMAELSQIANSITTTARVVVLDNVAVREIVFAAGSKVIGENDVVQAVAVEKREQIGMHGAGDYEAIGQTGRLHDGRNSERRRAGSRRMAVAGKEQIVTLGRAIFFDSEQQQRLRSAEPEIVAKDQADDARFRLNRRARTRAEFITQFASNGFDAFAQTLVHIGMAIQNT